MMSQTPLPPDPKTIMYNDSQYSTEFLFRLWLFPNDSEPYEMEIWVHALENPWDSKMYLNEWVSNAMSCYDHMFRKEFGLDTEKTMPKYWQIIGKAKVTLQVTYSLDGSECEEKIEILEFQKCEVPESYHKGTNLLSTSCETTFKNIE